MLVDMRINKYTIFFFNAPETGRSRTMSVVTPGTRELAVASIDRDISAEQMIIL
jgi:hypothetical protein